MCGEPVATASLPRQLCVFFGFDCMDPAKGIKKNRSCRAAPWCAPPHALRIHVRRGPRSGPTQDGKSSRNGTIRINTSLTRQPQPASGWQAGPGGTTTVSSAPRPGRRRAHQTVRHRGARPVAFLH